VIVRILGEGQYRLSDEAYAAVNALDDKVQAAVEQLATAFREQVDALAEAVRSHGQAVPVEEILPSDAVVPGPTTALADALELMTDEGLIPG
jgi:hypothetical protein